MADGTRLRIKATECHLDARNINALIKAALQRKAASITKDPDLRKDIGEQYVIAVTPYVPMKTGKLRESGRATNDGRVTWSTSYAEIQYTTQFRRYTTPGTGPYWTDKVKPGTDAWEQFAKSIEPLIIRRFNDG